MVFVFFNGLCPVMALDATQHLGPLAGLVVFWQPGHRISIAWGMGSYHFLAIESLSLYGIDASSAFTHANLSFLPSRSLPSSPLAFWAWWFYPVKPEEGTGGGIAAIVAFCYFCSYGNTFFKNSTGSQHPGLSLTEEWKSQGQKVAFTQWLF
ncbi:MAG: hypothetical protein IPH36_09635 [Saprospiraceae bacterium]|nr:hypothetical protein [Saprospiraceae bacterium]